MTNLINELQSNTNADADNPDHISPYIMMTQFYPKIGG